MNPNALNMRLVVFFLLLCSQSFAQVESVAIDLLGTHQYTFFYSSYTSNFDVLDRPYVYSASNELGLVCFDISDAENPIPVDTIPPSALDGLKVSNLHQVDNLLYLALGGFQGFVPENAGCAIVNTDDPENLELIDVWSSPDFNQGSAIVLPDDDLAYLGAMDSGLVILDISVPSNIEFISSILPDPNFPQEPGLFSVPNARGMDVDGDVLYVCNDAGGIRAIDLSDPSNPEEIGLHMNWDLEDIAQPAYNNAVIRDQYLYTAVDYCGWEVIDITDPENMVSVAWYNPWDCDSSNWDGRAGHTNQVNLVDDLDLLFFSGGDSEVLVYEISDPLNATLVGSYAALNDDIASWGMNVKEGLIALSLLNNPIGVPYDSSFGGVGILEWGMSLGDDNNFPQKEAVLLAPNPASDRMFITGIDANTPFDIYSVTGTWLSHHNGNASYVDVEAMPNGFYILKTANASRRFVVSHH
jgi:hypothetical protein